MSSTSRIINSIINGEKLNFNSDLTLQTKARKTKARKTNTHRVMQTPPTTPRQRKRRLTCPGAPKRPKKTIRRLPAVEILNNRIVTEEDVAEMAADFRNLAIKNPVQKI